MFKVKIIWNFNSILAWGCAVLLGIVLGMKPSYDLLVQSQKKTKTKKTWKMRDMKYFVMQVIMKATLYIENVCWLLLNL